MTKQNLTLSIGPLNGTLDAKVMADDVRHFANDLLLVAWRAAMALEDDDRMPQCIGEMDSLSAVIDAARELHLVADRLK